jgi:predicted enzyme related to lactoylglutathione lyase
MHYNYCRIHQTLRVTPAMQAGLSDHVWELDKLVGLLEADEAKNDRKRRDEAREVQGERPRVVTSRLRAAFSCADGRMAPMLTNFSHVMIHVNDMERAVKWYASVLGFVGKYVSAPHYASLWNESLKLRIDLHPDSQGENVGHGAMLYFAADDLDQAVAELRRRGVHVSDPRSRANSPRFTEFADSEGNAIGLYEKVPLPEN